MRYLEWLSSKVIPDVDKRVSYQKLLGALHETKFIWNVDNDGNRAFDGEKLRIIFEDETGEVCRFKGACTVLEMMVALAIRCENDIMWDPDVGDRTYIWFWDMIRNLNIDWMDDWAFNQEDFDDVMDIFLSRKYDKDGYGGLFYIAGTSIDMRKIEIWYQMNYWLRSQFE